MRTAVLFVLVSFPAPDVRAQTQYFPHGVLCAPVTTEFCERWYSRHLRAMGEPSLWELSQSQMAATYRFLWLRTFHHPVSARLSIATDGSGELVVKVLNGAGGYEPGHLIQDRKITVSKDDVNDFLQLLEKANFWSSPTEEGAGGCDGAQWVMEAAKRGRYHVVDRWSPKEGDAYRNAALFLAITLGGLNPRYNDVY
jgi:hypothetical protein